MHEISNNNISIGLSRAVLDCSSSSCRQSETRFRSDWYSTATNCWQQPHPRRILIRQLRLQPPTLPVTQPSRHPGTAANTITTIDGVNKSIPLRCHPSVTFFHPVTTTHHHVPKRGCCVGCQTPTTTLVRGCRIDFLNPRKIRHPFIVSVSSL